MNKFLGWMSLAVVVMFTSCASIKTIDYDSLEPARVTFPAAIKKVGVINNMPTVKFNDKVAVSADRMFEGDGKLMSEALAYGIADTDYFDEVILYDSLLCNLTIDSSHQLKDEWPGNVLSLGTINQLTDQMGVDLLFSVERARIELKKAADMSNLFAPPVIDGIISVVMRCYIPQRKTPMMTITRQDTLVWEPNGKITYSQIVNEASEYAVSMLLPHVLPTWKETTRYYFDSDNGMMRDAGIYVRENNWEEARNLWMDIYNNKKKGAKFRAAYNLSLYYEFHGDYQTARSYLDEAEKLAHPESDEELLVNILKAQIYESEQKYSQLRLQMQRFEDKYEGNLLSE